jgi:hypothetical protein
VQTELQRAQLQAEMEEEAEELARASAAVARMVAPEGCSAPVAAAEGPAKLKVRGRGLQCPLLRCAAPPACVLHRHQGHLPSSGPVWVWAGGGGGEALPIAQPAC